MLKAVYLVDIAEFDKENAIKKFYENYPIARIRQVYTKGMF
jgi:hypothetical protein